MPDVRAKPYLKTSTWVGVTLLVIAAQAPRMARPAAGPEAGNRDWHTLRITMAGREITGDLDGKKLLVAEDSTFPDAGMVGLWSKADAQSYFDDLSVHGE